MKTYLFIFVAGVTAIFFSYVAGVWVGNEKCRADTIVQAGVIQSETIKIIRNVNAETFNTATGDVRRFLREKYTIAE